MLNKNTIISIVLGVLLLSIFVFYVNKDLFNNEKIDSVATTTLQIEEIGIDNIEISNEGGELIKIEEIIDENVEITKENILIPDLDRKIVFLDDFPEDAQQIMIDRLNTIIQDIKNNPDSYDDWMNLGLQRKIIDDYEGVKLAWEYAKYLNPDHFLVWGNLGDLYAYYLKDNIKAEENYIGAIEYGSHQIPLYFKIAEFYREFMNNTLRAIEMVKLGIEINPNSQDLKNLLESLKE
ncbi:MAG: hypothetical protein KAR54_00265 [Candidatus Pacebacteria bacterium]|nr:hypothetical protein [Candidatus Paceibacterota bacterium]